MINPIQLSESHLKVLDAMKPIKYCPLCGEYPNTRISFKGRKGYRNKRKTQYCDCGWSQIIPTEREAMIELGFIEDN